MELDYTLIGKRIAHRRKTVGMTQARLSEIIDRSAPYISNIERAISIPSTEVIMQIAIALKTTPDEFLIGAVKHGEDEERWRSVAELLRGMDEEKLEMARSFLLWLTEKGH